MVLIGRLTKDPTLNFAAGSGTGINRFTVAINRPKKKDQEKAEADFINCVAFGKTAETIANYFTKGRQIALRGHIQTGNYTKDDGTKVYTTDVMVESFEFVGDRGNSSEKTNSSDAFGKGNYSDDMVPVDDSSDMPF